MSVENEILDALNERLKDLTFSPAIPIEWPRRPFTQPDGPWLRPTLLRGGPSVMALPNNSNNLYPGIYQVDVFYKLAQEGDEDITLTAGLIAAHFSRGTAIEAGDYVVRIMAPPALLPIQPEAEIVMLPVRITWRTYARS